MPLRRFLRATKNSKFNMKVPLKLTLWNLGWLSNPKPLNLTGAN